MFLYIINIIYKRCSWIIQRDCNNFPVKFPFINHGQGSQGLDLKNFTNFSPSFTNLNDINYKQRQPFYRIEMLLNWNKQMLESTRKASINIEYMLINTRIIISECSFNFSICKRWVFPCLWKQSIVPVYIVAENKAEKRVKIQYNMLRWWYKQGKWNWMFNDNGQTLKVQMPEKKNQISQKKPMNES